MSSNQPTTKDPHAKPDPLDAFKHISLAVEKVNEKLARMLGLKDVQIATLQVTIDEIQSKYNDLLNHADSLQKIINEQAEVIQQQGLSIDEGRKASAA